MRFTGSRSRRMGWRMPSRARAHRVTREERTMGNVELREGSIIQITDGGHPWFPALLIVDEVKTWGVQAFAFIPESNVAGPAPRAYNRLKTGSFEVVGQAAMVPA